MMEKLIGFFKPGHGMRAATAAMVTITQLIEHFEGDLAKEGNSRDAICDALIEVIQEVKKNGQAS